MSLVAVSDANLTSPFTEIPSASGNGSENDFTTPRYGGGVIGEHQGKAKAELCRFGLKRAGLGTESSAVVRVRTLITVESTLTHDCDVQYVK